MDASGPAFYRTTSASNAIYRPTGTIFDKKRRVRWGWAARVKPSRYDGAMLRMIRKHGQARECERCRRTA